MVPPPPSRRGLTCSSELQEIRWFGRQARIRFTTSSTRTSACPPSRRISSTCTAVALPTTSSASDTTCIGTFPFNWGLIPIPERTPRDFLNGNTTLRSVAAMCVFRDMSRQQLGPARFSANPRIHDVISFNIDALLEALIKNKYPSGRPSLDVVYRTIEKPASLQSARKGKYPPSARIPTILDSHIKEPRPRIRFARAQ